MLVCLQNKEIMQLKKWWQFTKLILASNMEEYNLYRMFTSQFLQYIPISMLHNNVNPFSWFHVFLAHFGKNGSSKSSCLSVTCSMTDFHLAMMHSLNPFFAERAHQYKWFLKPVTHSAKISHSFSLLAFKSCFVKLLLTCQISKNELFLSAFLVSIWPNLCAYR